MIPCNMNINKGFPCAFPSHLPNRCLRGKSGSARGKNMLSSTNAGWNRTPISSTNGNRPMAQRKTIR